MITEKLNKLVEIRPGRNIFTRHWILNDDEEESSTKTSSRTVNLVCVHGTAASQEQYISLWKALDSLLSFSSTETSSTLRMHCWAYDAIGCGRSPKIRNNIKAYTDAEQVQDLQELLENHVDSKYDTYFVGHSYGPTWIYKCLLLLQQGNKKLSTTTLKPAGLVLISTGLECKELVVGGPAIFRVVPLWFLKCIQPLLTASFLKLGFSPYTHKHDPELIVQAKEANNQNDMQVVIYYYKAHAWLSQLSPESMPPALVLHGTDDEIVPIHCGQQVANQLRTTLVAVTDASHMILMEKPDKVAQHLVDFLQQ
jgi:pimeloyl-ACP methyl ester carboxylesterase